MDNNNMDGFTGMPQQPVTPGVPPQQPVQDMTTAPQQPVQDMTMAPQQPVQDMTTAPQQPVQDMTMAPQQPAQDMTTAPQQPVQDMTMAPQQPVQDMTMASQQPVQDMTMAPQQPVQDMAMAPQQPNPGMGAGMMSGMQPGMGMPGMMPPQPPVQPNGKTAKVKKPMTKGKLTAIIAGSVVGIAAIVCGVIFLPKLFKSDKEKVLDAYEATFDTYAESNSVLSEKLGEEELQKTYAEKGGETSTDFAFTMGDDTLSIEYSQSGSTVIDQQNKQLSGSSVIGLNGADLLTVNMFGDEENTFVEVPELIDGYLGVPNKNFMGALAESALGQEMGLEEAFATMPSYDLDYFGTLSGDSESMEIYSGYVDAIEQVWDKAEFEKQGKAKIDVNGKTVTAKEYYVTLKKDDIVEALSSLLDGIEESVASNEAMLEESGMSLSDFQYAMQQVDTLLPSFVTKDFVIKVYVKDKKVVKTVMKDDINLFGASLGYDIWMDTDENDFTLNLGFSAMDENAGVKIEAHDLKGNTNGKISLFAAGESMDINFNKTVTEAGSVKTTNWEFSMTDYFTLGMTWNYDESGDAFDGSVNLDIVGEDTMVATFAGKWANIQKGVAYDFVIDQLDIKVANQDIMSMSMSVGVDTSNTSAQALDSGKTVYMLTDMTASDFEAMVSDNQALMEEWMININADPAFQDLLNLFTPSQESEDQPMIADEANPEDTVIEFDGVTYKILGCLDGFEYWGSDYGIEYDTESYSGIVYDLYSGESAQELLDTLFSSYADDETPALDSAYDVAAQVDGKDVLYTYEVTDFYDETPVMNLTAVTEVEPGLFMTISALIYTNDDPLTAEDVIQALSSQYYEKQ